MPLFRKKPVVIEAEQFDGSLESAMRICEPGGSPDLYYGNPKPGDWSLCVMIRTLEGVMTASAGDWIITGVKGEKYPCRNDIFEATYEPVLGDDPGGPS